MNKKGFTLVELLSVLVLIGLLMGIAVPGISRISTNIKKKSQKTKIQLIEKAAVLWGQDNRTLLYDKDKDDCPGIEENVSYCEHISISSLIEESYLDGENNSKRYEDPVTGDDLNRDECVVYVYKLNNRVSAKFNINQKGCHPDN